MTDEDMKALKDAAEKVVALIRYGYDPHTTVIIQSGGIRVVRDEAYIPLK